MINAGVDLYTIGAVLGHKSAVSTARYTHLAHARLRDAVGAIGKKMAKMFHLYPRKKRPKRPLFVTCMYRKAARNQHET